MAFFFDSFGFTLILLIILLYQAWAYKPPSKITLYKYLPSSDYQNVYGPEIPLGKIFAQFFDRSKIAPRNAQEAAMDLNDVIQ